ncbi:MAG: winged helix-turn-helix transcriptional regulator [Clostridiales bacterium]|nr:winged helix-turn-helix transcriptional regulator [Clostridiales bacterium]
MSLKVSGLDDLDFQILDILLKDSRTPFLEIARECHVSGGTIHVRMKKMQDMNIIKGTKLIIDNSKIGYDVCGFIGIYLDKARNFKDVLDKLIDIKEIVEIHYTTGVYSIFIKIICKNISDLQDLLMNKIQSIDGIQRTDTIISLYQPVERSINIDIINNTSNSKN